MKQQGIGLKIYPVLPDSSEMISTVCKIHVEIEIYVTGDIEDTIDVMISVICILHLLLRMVHPHHTEVQFLCIEL